MTEELVTLETAQLAREKGFDEVCSNVWHYWGEKWHEGRDILAHSPDKPLPLEIRAMYDDLLQYSPTKNSTLPADIIARPTQDLLERWLREVHNYYVQQELGPGGWNYLVLDKDGAVEFDSSLRFREDGLYFATYELAREAALLHALKLLP